MQVGEVAPCGGARALHGAGGSLMTGLPLHSRHQHQEPPHQAPGTQRWPQDRLSQGESFSVRRGEIV